MVYNLYVQFSSPLTIKSLDAIIPGNMKKYKNSKIPAITPSTFLKVKENTES